MFKRKLTESDWLLLAANLAPIAGVLFAGWDPYQVFLAYCLETIIIGLFTFIKLGIATYFRRNDPGTGGSETAKTGLFLMFFFLLHYGIFVAIQTTLFLEAAHFGQASSPGILDILSRPGQYLGNEAWLLIVLFALAYAYQNIAAYIRDQDHLNKPVFAIMFEPYSRIFVQQFTVVLGALVISLGGGLIFILLFAAVKAYFTIFFSLDVSKIIQERSSSHS